MRDNRSSCKSKNHCGWTAQKTFTSHLKTGFKCDAVSDVIFQSDITRVASITEYFTATRGGACVLLFTDCHSRHLQARPQDGVKMQGRNGTQQAHCYSTFPVSRKKCCLCATFIIYCFVLKFVLKKIKQTSKLVHYNRVICE